MKKIPFLNALILFSRERFPARVTIPLSLVLFGAPASLVRPDAHRWVTGAATVFLALLALRIVDDISDIEMDAISKPERGLVCGRIDITQVKRGSSTCAALIALLNTSWPSLLTVSATAGFYAIFYGQRHRIPIMLRPFLINMIFFIIPVYVSSLKNFYDIYSILLLALFVWLAVVAHDFAHSVHGPDEGFDAIKSFSDCIGAKGSALLSAVLFACSGITGTVFWYLSGAGPLFLISLCCTSAFIGLRCRELIKRPRKATAKKFYVAGFLFFIVPLTAIIIETVIKNCIT